MVFSFCLDDQVENLSNCPSRKGSTFSVSTGMRPNSTTPYLNSSREKDLNNHHLPNNHIHCLDKEKTELNAGSHHRHHHHNHAVSKSRSSHSNDGIHNSEEYLNFNHQRCSGNNGDSIETRSCGGGSGRSKPPKDPNKYHHHPHHHHHHNSNGSTRKKSIGDSSDIMMPPQSRKTSVGTGSISSLCSENFLIQNRKYGRETEFHRDNFSSGPSK